MRNKLAVIVALLILAFASVGALKGEAQEAPLDLGEPSLLVVACNNIRTIAISDGLGPKACRRAAPDEVTGYKAKVTLTLYTAAYSTPFLIEVSLQKSLWTMQGFEVTG